MLLLMRYFDSILCYFYWINKIIIIIQESEASAIAGHQNIVNFLEIQRERGAKEMDA